MSHSVTRTPVDERYRVDGDAIVQTGIAFEQHGPGLPTEADAGGTLRARGRRFRRDDDIAASTSS